MWAGDCNLGMPSSSFGVVDGKCKIINSNLAKLLKQANILKRNVLLQTHPLKRTSIEQTYSNGLPQMHPFKRTSIEQTYSHKRTHFY